jgi:hypothetical protein
MRRSAPFSFHIFPIATDPAHGHVNIAPWAGLPLHLGAEDDDQIKIIAEGDLCQLC